MIIATIKTTIINGAKATMNAVSLGIEIGVEVGVGVGIGVEVGVGVDVGVGVGVGEGAVCKVMITGGFPSSEMV